MRVCTRGTAFALGEGGQKEELEEVLIHGMLIADYALHSEENNHNNKSVMAHESSRSSNI